MIKTKDDGIEGRTIREIESLNFIHRGMLLNTLLFFLELSCYKVYKIFEDSLQIKTFEEQDNKQNLPMNYIFTPGFDNKYKANETCVWHITGKNGTGEFEVKFQYLELEKSKGCLYDYVRVYKKGHGQHDWDQVKNITLNLMQ